MEVIPRPEARNNEVGFLQIRQGEETDKRFVG